MTTDKKNTKKNTLLTPQSTQPLFTRIPSVKPTFTNFKKPGFNVPKFNTAFRTQNRGGGGK